MSRRHVAGATLAAACLAATSASALTVTPTSDADALVSTLIGPGVSLIPGTASFTGDPGQAGTFSNGLDALPISAGVVLSSGLVSEIPGPNTNGPESVGVGDSTDDDLSTDFGGAGAPEIANSFDAASLEFEFQFGDGSVGGEVNFGFVFASEEYIDFIDSEFNDEFQLLINGTNVGLIGGVPVNINNVNNTSNSGCYVNNVSNTDGLPNAGLGFKFDGRTCFLTASAAGLGAGTHTARFVVADVADGILDAGVFIQAGSFSPDDPRPDIPVPAALPLLLTAVGGLALAARRRS
jgi:hypothetical protein